MSKVKNWAWDKAEEKLDDVVDRIENGTLTQSQAVKEIQDADENWGLVGFDTVEDVIDFLSEIKVKVSC
jgi:negative regulator of genetic competence, sporulation and motility